MPVNFLYKLIATTCVHFDGFSEEAATTAHQQNCWDDSDYQRVHGLEMEIQNWNNCAIKK